MADSIDARGLSCPQPTILTRTALTNAGSGQVIIHLDSMTQVQNCSRSAEKLGWQVSYEEKDGAFVLKLTKEPRDQ